jgi:hypothetical protein
VRRADHSQETDIHDPGGIRTHNPSKRAAVDPRLRPRGHWDRLYLTLSPTNPTQSAQGLNPGIPGERVAANRLSHDTAFVVLYWKGAGVEYRCFFQSICK